ncbi:unnamed protein product [Owenia fusiformis]|uniref:Uncharacterized protein n=1 Tax=Owenia fusiformis TaxID=6347 RepID=A0A8J1XX41_OWEFU|nr:unnamed protein product [Owenia fusiformis]
MANLSDDVSVELNKDNNIVQHPNAAMEQDSSSEPSKPPISTTNFKMPVFGKRPGFKKPNVFAKEKVDDVQKTTQMKPIKDSENSEQKDSDKKKEINNSPKLKPTPELSSEEKRKQAQVMIPYKEPIWSGVPEQLYTFDILKSGQIVDTIDLTSKGHYVFGRLPSCDVTLEHPSLSRYHAVIQYCSTPTERHQPGWYVYDLDSTHGTWANKVKLNPRIYYRLRVGHMVKFGGSTRLFILQGPAEDQEEESELSITEMKELRERQKNELEILKAAELEKSEGSVGRIESSNDGCSWGIDDDAMETEGDNPFALPDPKDEELYIDDPKKSLRGWFEREGYDQPEYDCEEVSRGTYRCRVDLPVDSPTGQDVVAEAEVSGKKRDAVVACALEACRILDRYDVLRQAQHESRKKKSKNWEENDFYDSDDDEFLDRTGVIQKKRKDRMKKAGKVEEKTETYDTLLARLKQIESDIQDLEEQLAKAKKDAEAMEDEDDLDAFMSRIKTGAAIDKKTRMKWKRQLFDLRQEEQKVRKLVNKAKPANMPEITRKIEGEKEGTNVSSMVGRIKMLPKGQQKKVPVRTIGPPRPEHLDESNKSQIEEEEEEETEAGNAKSNDSIEDTTKNKNTDNDKSKNTNTLKVTEHLDTLTKSEDTKITEDNHDKEVIAKRGTVTKSEATGSKSDTSTNKSGNKKEKSLNSQSSNKNEARSKGSKHKIPLDDDDDEVKKPKGPKIWSKQYNTSDPDYAVWMPPQGQSGDGKTKLNEKYGY